MASLTSQHLLKLYDTYRETEVTFNSQVISESGLCTGEVRLKIGDTNLPCVLFACSMKGARVITEVTQSISEAISQLKNATSLRLAFEEKGYLNSGTFFVSCRVESISEYNPEKPNIKFIALEFTQQPSDQLIAVLGSLLEIKSNALRRLDERIVVTPEVMRKIGVDSKGSCVAIEGAAKRCILRDISFGGAKVLVSAIVTPQSEKKVQLKLSRCELQDETVLNGSIIRVEDVQGRDDLVALSIQFSSETPLSYKQKINSLFTT